MNLSVLCFRTFSVAKKFIDKRGGYQDFPSKNVSLTVPKFSEGAGGEHFSVSLISGIEKVWIRGGGSIEILRGKFFVSQSQKIWQGNTL